MYGPSFSSVGGTDGIALKDITFPATDTGDELLLIDTATAAYTTLTYVTAEGASDEGLEEGAGWYDFTSDAVYMGNYIVTRGCAFWLHPFCGDVTITAAGEVRTTYTRTFPNNLYSAFANPFPTEVALKDFNYPATDTGDEMLLIDPITAAYTTLTYVTEEGASDEGLEDGAGWYDFTTDAVYMGDYKFKGGEGAWLHPFCGDITMTATLDVGK